MVPLASIAVAVSLMLASPCEASNVDFYSRCGNQLTAYSTSFFTLEIDGASSFLTSCSVTFRASSSSADVMYKFTMTSIPLISDVTINVYTKQYSYESYDLKRSYSSFNTPTLGFQYRGERYVKVTVTRFFGSSSFSAELSVETDETILNSSIDGEGLATWTIACIAVGSVIFCIIVIVSIACACAKSHGRQGRVVRPMANVQMVTTTTTGNLTYPYQTVIPSPPSYQQLYTGSQPGQPLTASFGQPSAPPPPFGQPSAAPPPFGQPSAASPSVGQPSTAPPSFGQPSAAPPLAGPPNAAPSTAPSSHLGDPAYPPTKASKK